MVMLKETIDLFFLLWILWTYLDTATLFSFANESKAPVTHTIENSKVALCSCLDQRLQGEICMHFVTQVGGIRCCMPGSQV